MPDEDFLGGDAAADAFLKRLEGTAEGTPGNDSGEGSEGTPNETEVNHEGGFEGQGTEGHEEGGEGTSQDDPDDAEVSWKEGENEVKAKLRDLKESFKVREQSQTEFTKAQETAQKAAAESERATTALNKMLERAKERWAPYEKIDWLVAAKEFDAETLAALRKDATDALNDVRFLQTELDGTVQAAQAERQKTFQAAAQAALKELTDPQKGIPGFNQELYGKIVQHAVSLGAPEATVRGIIDPWAIKLLHQAMLYSQGAQKVQQSAQKVANKPTKQLGQGKRPDTKAEGDAKSKALAELRKTHSVDAATDAFMASLASRDDE